MTEEEYTYGREHSPRHLPPEQRRGLEARTHHRSRFGCRFAKAFYAEQLGFNVDVDHRAGEDFRIVQLTPSGSACSITLMRNTDARPGSLQGLHLIVDDIEAARAELVGNGVDVSDLLPLRRSRPDAWVPSRTRATTSRSFRSPTPTGTAGWCKRSITPSSPYSECSTTDGRVRATERAGTNATMFTAASRADRDHDNADRGNGKVRCNAEPVGNATPGGHAGDTPTAAPNHWVAPMVVACQPTVART